MNESNPLVPPAFDPVVPTYKDRSGGLVVFGVLTILLGILAGGMVGLMLLGQALTARNPNASTSFAMILPGLLIYGGLAIALIWIGIGSIIARRWARALLLIFSWSVLVMGAITVIAMIVILPRIMANLNANVPAGQEGGAMIAGMIFAFVILGVLFIVIPGVWIFFYGSRDVKATCEARNPEPGWTDACPLPVLATSLWLWFAVPMMVLMPLIYHGVAPFFGTFLSGVPGTLFYLVMAAVWGWVAWRLYRLDVRAWWVLLVALVLFCVSNLLTYTHHDMLEMYRLMGYPEEQIDQLQKTGLMNGNHLAWITVGSMLPFVGYLLFVKKYLRAKQ